MRRAATGLRLRTRLYGACSCSRRCLLCALALSVGLCAFDPRPCQRRRAPGTYYVLLLLGESSLPASYLLAASVRCGSLLADFRRLFSSSAPWFRRAFRPPHTYSFYMLRCLCALVLASLRRRRASPSYCRSAFRVRTRASLSLLHSSPPSRVRAPYDL